MPTAPVYRAARAVVFATVCVGLAITGHTMVSGMAVPPMAAAAGMVLLTALGASLAGAERSLATILGCLLGGQFVLHALFAAAQHGQMPGHGHAASLSSSLSLSSGGAAMTFAHVVATVVSAWWLRRGERAVWRLARRLAVSVAWPVRALLSSAPPVPTAAAPSAPRAAATARPREVRLRHVLVRRGPPSPWAAPA